ncbi:MAG: tRNA (adenosine(37)-N6)-threonylcarbamoyltransferase complex dimerization subunit type 1 TsaB [Rhodocyclaceae bacterium]|nr:tRNA (adenosine(37)-N6)-threonylcarbamoyltransferase complex dimerization subunit type 1 TsaB [Rhodocyclaceae bacterium]
MKLLAFEASTRRLSVALWCAGALAEKSADVPNGGSEKLLPWANELLAAAGLSLKQLDGIACGAGPGGFTGLRLACGVAQGLAFGLDLPVVPVGTLAAMALASGEGKVLAYLDARMNEVYVAAYIVAGETVEEVMPPKVGAGETALLPDGTGWRGAGDGFSVYGEVLRRRMGERLIGTDLNVFPTASAVARLAVPVLARGGGVDAALAVPFYVRDKVALTTAERLARGGNK